MTTKDLQLDKEELQMLRDFERGEFESIQDLGSENKELEESACDTLSKRAVEQEKS
jgi:hypothetical protein